MGEQYIFFHFHNCIADSFIILEIQMNLFIIIIIFRQNESFWSLLLEDTQRNLQGATITK